jgi:hypothetical protein
MIEPGDDLDLAIEPLRPEHGAELRSEHLDRHLAAMLQIVGQVDRRHAAVADLALDGVAAGEGGAEAV